MPWLLLRPQPPAPLPPAPPAHDARQRPAAEEAPAHQACGSAEQPLLEPPEHTTNRPGLHLPPLRRLEGLALLLITALMWGEPGCTVLLLVHMGMFGLPA